MNAQDWQAAAEVLGAVVLLGNLLGGLFIYRLTAKFVTRAEHHTMGARLEEFEEKVGVINQTISGLFTNEKAQQLYDKMGSLATQNAQLLGELPGVREQLKAFNHQLNLLIQNELNQSGKR